jgi:hypothetical protein
MSFDENDAINSRLKWAAWVGTQPEFVRQWLTDYPGTTCYKLPMEMGLAALHVWIQGYKYVNPDLVKEGAPPVVCDVLQGKGSLHPGFTIRMVPVSNLKKCDCGNWMPATKEDLAKSQKQFQEAKRKMQADEDYARLMGKKAGLN